jgi:hypothetical protein
MVFMKAVGWKARAKEIIRIKNRKSYICFNLCYRSMSKSSDEITAGRESKKAQADQKDADKKVTISKETASKSV